MGRVVAVDYGMKRCGLAWTDPLRISINPLKTVENAKFMKHLENLLAGGEIEAVVFGLSSHKDGTLTKTGQTVIKLVQNLKKKYPQVIFHTLDESFSSQLASELMIDLGIPKSKRRERGNIDRMSAVLILKEFLNNN